MQYIDTSKNIGFCKHRYFDLEIFDITKYRYFSALSVLRLRVLVKCGGGHYKILEVGREGDVRPQGMTFLGRFQGISYWYTFFDVQKFN